MEANAPGLWQMLSMLLDGGSGCSDQNDVDNGEMSGDKNLDTSYWGAIDEIDMEGFINGLTTEWGWK